MTLSSVSAVLERTSLMDRYLKALLRCKVALASESMDCRSMLASAPELRLASRLKAQLRPQAVSFAD